MNNEKIDLVQGTLDLLILKSLALGELHGLGIARRVEQMTRSTFEVKPGSLFPALQRMRDRGWIAITRAKSDSSRKAVYYELTKIGKRQLQDKSQQWQRISEAMRWALQAD